MPTFTNFKWNTITTDASEPYRIRALKAFEYVNWDALRNAAEEFRDVPCMVGEQYGLGGLHVVREILFDDDVHWIARVNLPRVNFEANDSYIPNPLHHTWSADDEADMQSEIDTMSFVREHTDIPVPRVFSYDTTATNPVRAPFMLMECCMGTCAMDMPESFHDIPGQFKHKYFNAEAAVLVSILVDSTNYQVKLWDLKFDKIGCVVKNPKTGTYDIGPLPNGLGGPYSTAAEYYRAWAAQNMSKRGATSDFVSQIYEVASLISKHNDGPFRLVHPDFGHNNIIVDDDFNILGVIDWEKAFVAPSEMAACFPLRLQIYPETLIPLARDKDGRIIDETSRRKVENRELFMTAVASQEDQLFVSSRLSTDMAGATADVLFLIRMWEEGIPWLYNYTPAAENGVNAVLNSLRSRA
jgi:Phosphotransferase enzyme family